MRNLLLEEGGLLQVESASLPVASYAKFQPQSVDFLDITNPKAVYPLKCKSFPLFLLAEVNEYSCHVKNAFLLTNEGLINVAWWAAHSPTG